MSIILDQANKLKTVAISMESIVRAALVEEKEFIEELNQKQLAKGQRADGTSLPNYSQTSVGSFGKTPGAIKLFDTGDFYKGITPLFESKQFQLAGLDDKTDMLVSRYGEILGLQKESIDELGQRIKPRIIEKARKILA